MMYHYSTENRSFLELHRQFKEEGSVDPLFIFTLYDKSLQNVDPYDAKLTTIQKHKILLECAENPWYFFREIIRIDNPFYDYNDSRFPINKGTLAILYTALLGINHIVRLPRQHNRDNTYRYLLLYLFLFGPNGNKIDMCGGSGEENNAIIEFIKNSIINLPEYFHTLVKFADNSKTFTNSRIDSSICKIKIPKTQYDAEYTARGIIGNMQYFPIADYNKYIRELYQASLPGRYKRQINDETQGISKLYTVMISSDLNENVTNKSSQFVEDIILRSVKWEDSFYGFELQKLHEFIERKSVNRFVHIEYNYTELGKDDDWFHEQCRMLNHDKSKINRYLLLTR